MLIPSTKPCLLLVALTTLAANARAATPSCDLVRRDENLVIVRDGADFTSTNDWSSALYNLNSLKEARLCEVTARPCTLSHGSFNDGYNVLVNRDKGIYLRADTLSSGLYYLDRLKESGLCTIAAQPCDLKIVEDQVAIILGSEVIAYSSSVSSATYAIQDLRSRGLCAN